MNSLDRGSNASDNTGYCGFVVGQHVVCIDDDFSDYLELFGHTPEVKAIIWPVKGVVYTIRCILFFPNRKNKFRVHLTEIVNKPAHWDDGFYENAWAARRFRPLQKLTPEQFMQTDAPVEGQEVAA